jgi:uncharacterized protein
MIDGPTGVLEARIEDPSAAGTSPLAVGVVCHPHPLHGGTMQNKVAYTAARALQEAGCATVRFNFRGVGESGGRYDDGIGEVEDALAAIVWARREFKCETLWLAGFSFGAAVALRAATQASAAQLITIAPPVNRILTEPVERPACPWLVVIGDRDELVRVAEVRHWVGHFATPPRLLVIAEASHFFHGKLTQLREGIQGFLPAGLDSGPVE